MKFKTRIASVKVLNPPKINDNFDGNGVFYVDWVFEVDSREGGIKDMSHSIQKIRGEVLINEWTDEDDVDTTFDIDSKDFDIIDDMQLVASSIWPDSAEIDFKAKTIRIW